MASIFAVGFDDQFPCSRNHFNFGVGATLFAKKEDAETFKGSSLYSLSEFHVQDAQAAIEKQDSIQRRHAENLGCKWEAPQRTQAPKPIKEQQE